MKRLKKRKKSLSKPSLFWLTALIIVSLIAGGIYARRNQESSDRSRFIDGYRYCVSVERLGGTEMARAEEKEKEEKSPQIEDTTKELIEYYAEKFEVDKDLVACILREESQFNSQAVGDQGKAVGVAQFWPSTYRAFRRAMGLPEIDERKDKAEAIKTLCFALSQGWGNHWSPVKNGRCR